MSDIKDKKNPGVSINWFPGHMQKAIRNIQEKLKLCDGVVEIGDSRAPMSSFPTYLDKITEGKVKILIFSKIDLCDKRAFERAVARYKERGIECFGFDLRNTKSTEAILKYLSNVKSKRDERYIKLGFPVPSKKFMVLGIPNVGKSTFINSLAKKKKAAVENRPGKTRTETLIKVSDKVSIFDVPGILEPNYEDKEQITKLALLGSIKFEILPFIYLTDYLLDYLLERYPQALETRYAISFEGESEEVFERLAEKRNYLIKDGVYDTKRARMTLLKEFQSGLLGGVSLDE